MTEPNEEQELSQVEIFLVEAKSELEQVRKENKEISLLVEQSQGEVEKLAGRNAQITSHLHQIQQNFDTIPREDIRSTYEAAQDAQQRLFTMRGQLEKLESDQRNLERLDTLLTSTIGLLEGKPIDNVGEIEEDPASAIELIIEAQEEERRAISRQIHDGPAQALSNFILQTEITARLFDTDQDKAREELNTLKAAASSTFSQVRDFIFDLRPMMLDDLGLTPTVRRYVEAFKDKTGLDVNVVVTGKERRMEPHIEVIIFRSIQALLANVRDHAQATQVKILLDLDETKVRSSVEDNGRGFDSEEVLGGEEKFGGLKVLKDRIEQLGGEIEIESDPGEGTHITFSISLE